MTRAAIPAPPRIAAIICTHNRADALARCLTALQNQTLPVSAFQVIVVDNASTDGTAGFLKNVAGNVRVIREDRPGLAIARNTGLRATDAPLVAFTDDDTEPGGDWLARIVTLFDELPDTVAGLGGEIDPVWAAAPPDWLTIEMLRLLSARLGWSLAPRYLQQGEWICEANSAYRRDILADFGGFPEHLGRVGASLLSGENAVNLKIEAAGHRFYFDPGIRVRHHIDADRVTKPWLRNRMFWQGITGYLVDQYLGDDLCLVANGPPVPQPRHLSLPASPEAWANMFSDTHAGAFADTLPELWSLGYALASQGLIASR